jgi:RHS repeat-associated protein
MKPREIPHSGRAPMFPGSKPFGPKGDTQEILRCSVLTFLFLLAIAWSCPRAFSANEKMQEDHEKTVALSSVAKEIFLVSLKTKIAPIQKDTGEKSSRNNELQEIADKTRQTARPGSEPTPQMIRQQILELESYVTSFPNSPYTPNLCEALGNHFRSSGRYSKALYYWEMSLNATIGIDNGLGKRIADQSIAKYSRLLASLGRVEELEKLTDVVGKRVLDGAESSVMWRITQEALKTMQVRPGVSYRCGALALNNAGIALTGKPFRDLLSVESPASGFNAYQLEALAKRNGLPFRAAIRERGDALVYPSVVHWKEDHYAALIHDLGEFSEVADPTFGGHQILNNFEISEEASGVFLIPDGKLPEGWRWLEPQESATVFGKGYPYVLDDAPDVVCPPCTVNEDGSSTCFDCPTGGPGRSPGDSGGGGCSRGRCFPKAMPDWWVSEPYINLWVRDIPLEYNPNKGPVVRLDLRLKQRTDSYIPYYYTGFGALWRSTWSSYIDTAYLLVVNQGFVRLYGRDQQMIQLYFGSGQTESAISYVGNLKLKWVKSGSTTLGFDLVYPDGQEDRYRFRAGNMRYFFLSQIVDRKGSVVSLNYDSIVDPDAPEVKLRTVVDADGNTFTLNYNHGTDGTLVTSVSSPVAGTVYMGYDDAVHLTDITDTVGIKSEFVYDSGGWPLEMVTPYGTTAFDITETYTPPTIPFRSILVTEPDGKQQLYAFQDGYGPNSDPPMPSGTPLNTLEIGQFNNRNSMHWGNAYVPLLSTLDFSTMTSSDFNKAHIKHWLGYNQEPHGSTPVHTLSWEIQPSPDGVVQGQATWYDYQNKPLDSMQGSQYLPSVIARVQPDNTTWYIYYKRNELGNITNTTEKWDVAGTATYRTNSYLYAANGNDLISHVDAEGNTTTWGYDAYHQVLYHTNAVGEVTSYTYNGNRQISTIVLPSGLTSTYTYNGSSYALEKIVESASGSQIKTNTFARFPGQTYVRATLNGGTYTNSTTWVVTTDPRGLVVTNIYDSLGRMFERRWPQGRVEMWHYELWPGQSYSGSTGGRYILDATGYINVLGGTNYSTNTWTYFPNRRLGYSGNAAFTYTAYEYCDCGSPSKITLGYGLNLAETTTNTYNLAGWKTSTVQPGGASVNFTYNLLGQPEITTDALGSSTNSYDNLGRLIANRNSIGQAFSRIYDRNDRVILVTDPTGVTTTNNFDGIGRLTARIPLGGLAERWGFTANVKPFTAYTNQVGNTTLFSYDALGRKTNEIVVGVSTNTFLIDGAGDMTDLYDGNGNRTQWRYDTYGRVVHKLYANGSTNLSYSYDLLGRITNRWSQVKGSTRYVFDKMGNLVLVDYASNADVSNSYDALNRLTNMVDSVGTTKWTYSNGLLVAEDGPWNDDTVLITYNSARKRSNLAIAGPTNSTSFSQGYTYDTLARIDSITGSAGTFGYTYRSGLSVTQPVKISIPITSGTGVAFTTNSYDSLGRLSGTEIWASNSIVVNSHGYIYDGANRRTRHTRPDGAYFELGYDSAGETIRAWATNSSGAAITTQRYTYGYDAVMNLTKRTNNATIETFSVNTLNQYTAFYGNSASHDLNGNLTSTTSSSGYAVNYSYDDENQLTSLSTDTYTTPAGYRWKITFTYDGKLRLRQRTNYSWNTIYNSWVVDSESRYIYDGMLLVQERTAANRPSVSYTRGSDLSGTLSGAGGIGGLLARNTHNTATSPYSVNSSAFYHADGGGNVTCLLNQNQSVGARYTYDPYGRILASSGAVASANQLRFSSKPMINHGNGSTTILYYYGYRFYSPELQRWMNRDPLVEQGWVKMVKFIKPHPIASQQLYDYCNNNPVGGIDPDGNLPLALAGCGVGAAGGGVGGAVSGFLTCYSMRGAACGFAGGAAGGCFAGAVCAQWPPACIAGGCVGGVASSIVQQACMGSLDLTNFCSWFDMAVSGLMGCTGGFADSVSNGVGVNEMIINMITGTSASSAAAICSGAQAL